jgi:plastocyanin
MLDRTFRPSILRLKAGDRVTVEVSNKDDTPHDFAIELMDLNTGIIEPGESATATFTVPESSTEFVCTLHSGMTGRIEVR